MIIILVSFFNFFKFFQILERPGIQEKEEEAKPKPKAKGFHRINSKGKIIFKFFF